MLKTQAFVFLYKIIIIDKNIELMYKVVMKLSQEYLKEMKRMKIANIIEFISFAVSSTSFFAISFNWLLYFLYK